MLNPSVSTGMQWYNNWASRKNKGLILKGDGTSGRVQDPEDQCVDFSCSKNEGNTVKFPGDGTIIMTGQHPRLYVNDLYKGAKTQRKAQNVEMTCYCKVVAAMIYTDSYTTFRLATRSNHDHTATCKRDGQGYASELFFDQNTCKTGGPRFRKEVCHPHYANSDIKNLAKGFDSHNSWLGMKFVLQNNKAGNVSLKCYWDKNQGSGGGAWTAVAPQVLVDTGTNWAVNTPKELDGIENDMNSGSSCRDAKIPKPYSAKITRAGYSSYLRTDGAKDVRFKWFSIREIAPLP